MQMKSFRKIDTTDEFDKNLKKLLKRFPSLNDDLETLIETQFKLFHKLGTDNNGIVRISNLGFDEPPIYKVRKFACKSLKGKGARTGMRLIYAYYKVEDRLLLIELYNKSEQEIENKSYIKKL